MEEKEEGHLVGEKPTTPPLLTLIAKLFESRTTSWNMLDDPGSWIPDCFIREIRTFADRSRSDRRDSRERDIRSDRRRLSVRPFWGGLLGRDEVWIEGIWDEPTGR